MEITGSQFCGPNKRLHSGIHAAKHFLLLTTTSPPIGWGKKRRSRAEQEGAEMEEKRIKKQRRREFLGGNPVTGGETWRGDKNSIVQSAAIYIHELKVARDQLQRRNEELKAQIMGHDEQQPCVTVQFEVDEPSSSIDSMIAALRRLKGMSVKARGIRSSMSGNRLWTEMNVETTIAACEVEKAVEEALKEVERNQPDSDAPFPGSKGWTQTSHVQNVF
uniref:BHLH domain-containing protein n=1 Tax=Oryza rufipogon TaxID=4529 RepID=A0A0E0P129_ORYRU